MRLKIFDSLIKIKLSHFSLLVQYKQKKNKRTYIHYMYMYIYIYNNNSKINI